MKNILLIFIAFSFIISGATCSINSDFRPIGLEALQSVTINTGNLTAVVIDNSSYCTIHRSGYNGIAELYHTLQDSSIFVPSYSGYNLEHIFGGDSLKQVFQPCNHPKKLYRNSDGEILSNQSPTLL